MYWLMHQDWNNCIYWKEVSADYLMCPSICTYSRAHKALHRLVQWHKRYLKLTSSLSCFKFKRLCLFPLLFNLASWLQFLSVVHEYLFSGLHIGLHFADVASIGYYWDLSELCYNTFILAYLQLGQILLSLYLAF